MPFGNDCEYADFAACTAANADKDDPDAYCAALMEATEAGCAARSEETMTFTGASSEDERRAAADKRREAMERRDQRPQLAERSAAGQQAQRDDDRLAMDRYLAFPGQLRAQTVERDGKSFHRVDGYATVFDRRYEMWDVFGPYEEEVDRAAADATIAAKPDVKFLINHRGLSLARTAGPWNGNNGTLELSVDEIGLRNVAWLNPERSEVKDLILAMDDGQVTEESFAFMIDEGEWNDDFTLFRIKRFDLNRGDVSAVNHGANPFTSIAARQQEIDTDLRMAGPGSARRFLTTLLARTDLDLDELADGYHQVRNAEREQERAEAAKGRSLVQIEAMLDGE